MMVQKPAKIIFVLLLIIFLLYGIAQSQEETKKTILDNGLTVLLREDHNIPVASLFIVYRVGSRNERFGITGISHLLEHMLFRGTEKFPPGKISRTLDVLGAEYNAFTTYDVTAYYETLPASYLEIAMEIEADRMVNSKLDSAVLEQEKTVVLAELEGDENSPLELLGNEVQAAHFIAHPYHWPVGGFKSDVAGISRDDVFSYYKTYYCPNNAVLTIVGDIDISKTLDMVKKYFGSIPAGKPVPEVKSVEPLQRSEKRVVLREGGKISYLQVAYHTPSIKDRDLYALAVLNSILAEGKSSRLYKALVDKGLATDISACLWDNIDPGMYSITVTVAPGREQREVEKALFKELEKFSLSKILEHDLKKAANQVKASFIKTKDSLTMTAKFLGWYEAIYTYEYLQTYLDNIRKVKEGDVRSVAEKYLRKSNRTVGWYCADNSKNMDSSSFFPVKKRYFGKSHFFSGAESLIRQEIISERPASGIDFMFTRHVLPNGLVVIVKENHSNPTVTISGYICAGCIFDPPGREGLSYFTASMLGRGSATRTFSQISEELDFLGASLSFIAGRETAEIRGWTLSEHLDRVLGILSDSLINPSFSADQKELVKKDIILQLREQSDSPISQALINLREMTYPHGHPYRSNIKGYENTVGQIGVQDLKVFHKKCYRPDSTVLVFVGDVDTNELLKKVEKFLGCWKKNSGPKPEVAVSPVNIPPQKREKIITMKEKHRVEVALGGKGVSRTDKDYYAFNLLNNVLGGNTLTSRLGTQLRDKEGLVYGVWSSNLPTKGEGLWLIMYGTNEKNVSKSLKLVRDIVKEIQTKPIEDDELADAKNTIINSLSVSLETNDKVAELLCEIEYFSLGKDYIRQIPLIYVSITKDDLLRVARKYIHMDRIIQVIAGPYKEQ